MAGIRTISALPLALLAFGLFLLLPVSTACAEQGEYAALGAQWAAAWGAGDLDGVMALYAAEPAFQPSLGERWAGTEAIRQHFAGALARYRGELHLHSQRSSASGDLAFDSGSYDETIRAVSGKGKPKRLQGGYLFVLQRVPGGDWKILEQIWTESGPNKL